MAFMPSICQEPPFIFHPEGLLCQVGYRRMKPAMELPGQKRTLTCPKRIDRKGLELLVFPGPCWSLPKSRLLFP